MRRRRKLVPKTTNYGKTEACHDTACCDAHVIKYLMEKANKLFQSVWVDWPNTIGPVSYHLMLGWAFGAQLLFRDVYKAAQYLVTKCVVNGLSLRHCRVLLSSKFQKCQVSWCCISSRWLKVVPGCLQIRQTSCRGLFCSPRVRTTPPSPTIRFTKVSGNPCSWVKLWYTAIFRNDFESKRDKPGWYRAWRAERYALSLPIRTLAESWHSAYLWFLNRSFLRVLR